MLHNTPGTEPQGVGRSGEALRAHLTARPGRCSWMPVQRCLRVWRPTLQTAAPGFQWAAHVGLLPLLPGPPRGSGVAVLTGVHAVPRTGPQASPTHLGSREKEVVRGAPEITGITLAPSLGKWPSACADTVGSGQLHSADLERVQSTADVL